MNVASCAAIPFDTLLFPEAMPCVGSWVKKVEVRGACAFESELAEFGQMCRDGQRQTADTDSQHSVFAGLLFLVLFNISLESHLKHCTGDHHSPIGGSPHRGLHARWGLGFVSERGSWYLAFAVISIGQRLN